MSTDFFVRDKDKNDLERRYGANLPKPKFFDRLRLSDDLENYLRFLIDDFDSQDRMSESERYGELKRLIPEIQQEILNDCTRRIRILYEFLKIPVKDIEYFSNEGGRDNYPCCDDWKEKNLKGGSLILCSKEEFEKNYKKKEVDELENLLKIDFDLKFNAFTLSEAILIDSSFRLPYYKELDLKKACGEEAVNQFATLRGMAQANLDYIDKYKIDYPRRKEFEAILEIPLKEVYLIDWW